MPQQFTAEDEKILKVTESQTAKMNLGQLQGYADAYKPSGISTGRTHGDDLRYEAIRRELEKRAA